MFKVFCILVIAFVLIEDSSVEGKILAMEIISNKIIIFLSFTAFMRRNKQSRGSGSSSLTVFEVKESKGCGSSCPPKKSSSCKCDDDDDDCECRKPKRRCSCPKPPPCVRIFLLDFERYFFSIHQFLPFIELSKLR